jgi:hypothetical protein
METANQQNNGDFNAELTQLRGANEEWPLNHYFVRAYGSCLALTDDMILVDKKLVTLYPRLRHAANP